MEGLRATIAILTFNGQEFLDEVLRACLAQEAPFGFEVLVIDSGSTDSTLDIVARHPAARLHQIPNREFAHGRTRNLAASIAGGEIVVFLTQDATPVGPNWLVDLLAPFGADPEVAGVFGRQVPRPGSSPAASRDMLDLFRDPPPGFFSNVCSAVNRSALVAVPFRDVNYAEDQAFAMDVAAAGGLVSYAPAATVRHSHELALNMYFRRMYDEARGIASLGRKPHSGLVWLTGAAVRGTVKDWCYLATQPNYTVRAKVWWALKVPMYNVARRSAIWLAGRPLPSWLTGFLSLDARRRQLAAG